VRASFLRVLVEEKTVVGSGVACVFQKALSAFGYSFMCNGIAAKFDKKYGTLQYGRSDGQRSLGAGSHNDHNNDDQ